MVNSGRPSVKEAIRPVNPPCVVCSTEKSDIVSPGTVRAKRNTSRQALCLGCQTAAVRA